VLTESSEFRTQGIFEFKYIRLGQKKVLNRAKHVPSIQSLPPFDIQSVKAKIGRGMDDFCCRELFNITFVMALTQGPTSYWSSPHTMYKVRKEFLQHIHFHCKDQIWYEMNTNDIGRRSVQ
jgi:hypothetical protein